MKSQKTALVDAFALAMRKAFADAADFI